MAEHIVFENQCATAVWSPSFGILSIHWQETVVKEGYIESIIACINFMRQNPTSTFISDRSASEYIWPRAQEWLSVHFGPTIARDHVYRFGFVMPRTPANRQQILQIASLFQEFHPNIEIELFTDMEAANRWALSEKAQKSL